MRAWDGPRPDVDGRWARVPPWREGVYAVVAVTGRAMISAPQHVTDADLAAWGVDGWGHAHDPRVMTRLAGEHGWVDVLDAVLLAEGTGSAQHGLVPRPDLLDHPRVRHALPIRGDVQVFGLVGDDESVLTLATGIGGLARASASRWRLARRGTGLGTPLARPPAACSRPASRSPPASRRPTCRACGPCCAPVSTRWARCRSTACSRSPTAPEEPSEERPSAGLRGSVA